MTKKLGNLVNLVRIDSGSKYNCIGCSLNVHEDFQISDHDFAADHLLEHHLRGDITDHSQMGKILDRSTEQFHTAMKVIVLLVAVVVIFFIMMS